MEIPFDEDLFDINFPVWVIYELPLSKHDDGETAIPLWTDRPAAERFIEEQRKTLEEYSLLPINGRRQLKALLAEYQEKGVTHVLFDSLRTKGRHIPIAEILDAIG